MRKIGTIVSGLMLLILSIIVFGIMIGVIHKEYKGGNHHTEYVPRETSRKEYFHSDDNSYVGSLDVCDGEYVLTIVDVATGKEHILKPNKMNETTDGE